MESLFPGLFFLSFLAPIVLRAALGVVLIYDARVLWKSKKRPLIAFASAISGVLIAVGLFTQGAVIAAGIVAVIAHNRATSESLFGNRATLVLSLAILLFLFVSGPGGLAFDVPY